MNFMFEWQEQYLRYCSCQENIKFISSRQRVMFFFFYYMEKPIQQKQKAGIVTSLNDTTTHKGDTRKMWGEEQNREEGEMAQTKLGGGRNRGEK